MHLRIGAFKLFQIRNVHRVYIEDSLDSCSYSFVLFVNFYPIHYGNIPRAQLMHIFPLRANNFPIIGGLPNDWRETTAKMSHGGISVTADHV